MSERESQPAAGAAGAADDGMAASQAQLGQALERARMGEDRDLAGWVRDRGERFVRVLFGLLRMTHLHSLDNAAFDKPITEMRAVIGDLFDVLGALHLVTVEDQVFINDIRIRLGRSEDAAGLGEELRRHGVGGLSLHATPTEAQLRLLVERFAADPDPDSPRAALIQAFADTGFDQIDLFGVYRFRISGDEENARARTRRDMERISSRAAELVEESWDNLTAARLPNPLPMRRIVTEILESEEGGDALWSAPSTSSSYGAHALQVTRLALLLARAAGLTEENIQDLGVAAMFHDMGYAAREGAAPELGDPGYAPPFERHAAAGARLLLRQRGFHQAKILRALATLDHHRDFADVEEGEDSQRPSLFGRIIRIAEDYANLTRRSAGGLSPRRALQRMVPAAGTLYDPVLLQLFVNTLGAYPPGTLLELETGHIVASVGTARSPETFDRPRVRLIRTPDGRTPRRVMTLDLARKGRVARVLDDLPAAEAAGAGGEE